MTSRELLEAMSTMLDEKLDKRFAEQTKCRIRDACHGGKGSGCRNGDIADIQKRVPPFMVL